MPRNSRGIRRRVFGSVLLILGCTVIVSDIAVGTEIDIFYILLVVTGTALLMYGIFSKEG